MTNKRPGRLTKHPGIWDLKDGRFRIRATVLDPRTGKQKERERIVEARDVYEALRERGELTRELTTALGQKDGSQDSLRDSMKLGDVAERWLKEITTKRHEQDPRQLHLCPTTRKKYTGVVRDFIQASWMAEIPIARISREDVRRWRKEQVDASYRASSVNSNFAVLQAILRAAGNREAADLPMLNTKQDARTTRKEPNKLNAQELDRFLAAAGEHWPQCHAAILMLFTTTLRPGALLALRMDDLDLETMEVVSSRRLSDGEIVPGVKADRFGEDVPPLLPEVYEAILELRTTFNDEQLASGLVFPARDGRHHDRFWLRRAFADCCKRAAITNRFTPTGARRTGETLYGRTVGTRAMAITGHRTEAMHQHYGSADAEEKLAMADKTWGPRLRVVKPEEPAQEHEAKSGDQVWGSSPQGSANY